MRGSASRGALRQGPRAGLAGRFPRLAALAAERPVLLVVLLYWLVSLPVGTAWMWQQDTGPTGMGAVFAQGMQLHRWDAVLLAVLIPLGFAVVVGPFVLAGTVLGLLLQALPGWLVALVVLGAVLVVARHMPPTRHLHRQARAHGAAQGRGNNRAILRVLALPPAAGTALEPGIPLGYVGGQAVGVPWDADAGHLAVIGPTRSGKSFHMTDLLLRWPGAAVVIDPKGEQWQRTVGFRQQACGPVYRLPPQGVDLVQLYDLGQDLDRRELHEILLRPFLDQQHRIFADKCLPLLQAAVETGAQTGEHPLRLLARWATMSPVTALKEALVHAPGATAVFTDGTAPEQFAMNRLAMSAWGTFTSRFSPFAAHLDTITAGTLPAQWAAERATLYLTYPLQAQSAVAPLAAAIVAGLVRSLPAQQAGERTLFAIDEMPAVALPGLATYLATVGGAGVTMALYAQNVTQIEAIYGKAAAAAILSNCTSQVFFPPRDAETAELLSRLYGTALEIAQGVGVGERVTQSYSTRYTPALAPAEALALPAGNVVLFSGGLRHIAQDSRSQLAPRLAALPPPPTVAAAAAPVAAVVTPSPSTTTPSAPASSAGKAPPVEAPRPQQRYW